ncbi:serine aminopeptidase domain-containing protein [Paraburkholderia sp. BCC1886]|uniref:serine aminopeptidase domain-containing protein n=1 Tax=Paraburkholderia sp. BCC1886 TaxID=2562670 RepID=UPI0011837360|nr:alpha/beta hydrolase [Paraburkholderia sp. BCC1886]
MKPIVFNGQFGWLHEAAGPTGVVLCSPFGYDALCTARGMRRLAERLAARGTSVLRFDYAGTGDSAGELGDADEPGRWRAWIDGIKQAVALLREQTGVERVTLCGLRLGGMLAALAAAELGDIDGLVLLAPVLSGRHYQRELRAHYRQWLAMPAAMDCTPEPETDEFVEAYGFRLYRDMLTSLREVDLQRDAARPARRVLVLDSLDPARIDALVAHYRAQGIDVERQGFDEYGRFMLEALDSEIPQAAFQSIETWVTEGDAGAMNVAADAALAHAQSGERAASYAVARDVVEAPVWLDDGKLFGIYCTPDARIDADRPAVLLLNTGAVSRIGNARLGVRFARRLAKQGIASLRVDLGALGDSLPSRDSASLDSLHSQTSIDQAAAAARWLSEEGHRGAVLVGVCAGAYVGLHAAAREPAVAGAVLVNLQQFVWRDICDDNGKPTVSLAAFGSTRTYLRSMCQPRKWLRVLKGQSGGWPVARELAGRFAARIGSTLADRVERLCGLELGPKETRRLFATLQSRGVATSLLYGKLDEGVESLERDFGVRGARLQRFGNTLVSFAAHTDHAILSGSAQENVMSHVEDFYRASFSEIGQTSGAALRAAPRVRGVQWLFRRHRASRLSEEG